jgi:hypothetical protein
MVKKLLCFQCHGPVTHAIDDVSEINQNKHHLTRHRSVVGRIVTLHLGVPGFEIHIQHIYRVFILNFLWSLPAYVGGCWISTSQFVTLFSVSILFLSLFTPSHCVWTPHNAKHLTRRHQMCKIKYYHLYCDSCFAFFVQSLMCKGRVCLSVCLYVYLVSETTERVSLTFHILLTKIYLTDLLWRCVDFSPYFTVIKHKVFRHYQMGLLYQKMWHTRTIVPVVTGSLNLEQFSNC